jgi:hypothetical protein
MDLRARPSSRPGHVARSAKAEEDTRHLGLDRRQAGSVRARRDPPDRLRRDGPLAGLLADRRALLAPARHLRRRVRDRAGDRPSPRRGGRHRRRLHGLLACRARGRPRRSDPAAARRLPRHAARAWARGWPLAAACPGIGVRKSGSCSAASPSYSRSRSPLFSPPSSTSPCAARTRPRRRFRPSSSPPRRRSSPSEPDRSLAPSVYGHRSPERPGSLPRPQRPGRAPARRAAAQSAGTRVGQHTATSCRGVIPVLSGTASLCRTAEWRSRASLPRALASNANAPSRSPTGSVTTRACFAYHPAGIAN